MTNLVRVFAEGLGYIVVGFGSIGLVGYGLKHIAEAVSILDGFMGAGAVVTGSSMLYLIADHAAKDTPLEKYMPHNLLCEALKRQ